MDLRAPAGGVLIVPMSREEFDELPEMPHTEWWDGACVVTGGTTTGTPERSWRWVGC